MTDTTFRQRSTGGQPRARSLAPPPADGVAERNGVADSARPTFSGARVLLVQSDRTLAEVLTDHLRHADFVVDVSLTAVQAESMARTRPPPTSWCSIRSFRTAMVSTCFDAWVVGGRCRW